MDLKKRIEALEQQVASLSSAVAIIALGLSGLKEAIESGQTEPEGNQQPPP